MPVADVKALQMVLAGAEYDLGKYGIDGSYGASAGLAVKALQNDLGITADGVYGPGAEEPHSHPDPARGLVQSVS